MDSLWEDKAHRSVVLPIRHSSQPGGIPYCCRPFAERSLDHRLTSDQLSQNDLGFAICTKPCLNNQFSNCFMPLWLAYPSSSTSQVACWISANTTHETTGSSPSTTSLLIVFSLSLLKVVFLLFDVDCLHSA